MEAVITIIQTLGFPIACVVALAFFIFKIWTAQIDVYKQREDRMAEQIDKFNETLTNFNITLITIDKRLENLEKTVDKE